MMQPSPPVSISNGEIIPSTTADVEELKVLGQAVDRWARRNILTLRSFPTRRRSQFFSRWQMARLRLHEALQGEVPE
jgi:hypothetical protein